MLGGLVAGAALSMMAVSSYGSARIRVVAGSLVAGKARIPLTALGEAEVLDRDRGAGVAVVQGRPAGLHAAARRTCRRR